jgi:hypothetical protein
MPLATAGPTLGLKCAGDQSESAKTGSLVVPEAAYVHEPAHVADRPFLWSYEFIHKLPKILAGLSYLLSNIYE